MRWTDGAGTPVLTVSHPTPTGPRRWKFGSRFDPAWNDLADTAALPGILRAWFFPETADPAADLRLSGAAQARPNPGGQPPPPLPVAWVWADEAIGVDLRPWALALAAAGFLLERLWTHRRPAQPDVVTR